MVWRTLLHWYPPFVPPVVWDRRFRLPAPYRIRGFFQRRPLCAPSLIYALRHGQIGHFFGGNFFKLSIFVKNAQKAPPDFGYSKTRRAVFSDDLSCRHSGICGVRFGISAVRIPRHEGKAEVIFLSRRYADGICSIVAKRMRC